MNKFATRNSTKRLLPYNHIAPSRLHYAYGANCFQHAIGYKPTLFSRTMYSGKEFVNYLGIQPGSVFHPTLQNEQNRHDFLNKLVSHCEEDNIIACGERLAVRDGFRTLALFTGKVGEMFDYHFAYLNGQGKWESKVPFDEARTYDTRDQAGLGYDFSCYMLAPKEMLPKAISEWTPRSVQIAISGGRPIELQEIDFESPGQFGNMVLFKKRENVAFIFINKELVTLPPWPPTAMPSLAATKEFSLR